eukprot:Lithocolla_globosa_v1_NODE_48_length_7768_cov_556.807727.p6 type:complete len:117 gc:universal NODE_48_length_7768_cov_556.807727:6718-6368(-)
MARSGKHEIKCLRKLTVEAFESSIEEVTETGSVGVLVDCFFEPKKEPDNLRTKGGIFLLGFFSSEFLRFIKFTGKESLLPVRGVRAESGSEPVSEPDLSLLGSSSIVLDNDSKVRD